MIIKKHKLGLISYPFPTLLIRIDITHMCSWGVFFCGEAIYVIHRELFFYNSVRCAALSSPKYAKKFSSRTLLIQCAPDIMLDEKQFLKI